MGRFRNPIIAPRSGGAAAEEVVDLSDWVNRSAGSDGQWGTWGAAAYRYDSTFDEWIAAECSAYTLAEFAPRIVGTESSATLTSNGWTVATASGGTVGTLNTGGFDWVSLNSTASNAATAHISKTITAGRGLYVCGWAQVDTTSGTMTGTTAMTPYHADGARAYSWHGYGGAPGLRAMNGASAGGMNGAANSLASAVWREAIIFPSGAALARTGGGGWTQGAGAAQFAASALTAVYFGDSSAAGSCRQLVRDTTTITLQ